MGPPAWKAGTRPPSCLLLENRLCMNSLLMCELYQGLCFDLKFASNCILVFLERVQQHPGRVWAETSLLFSSDEVRTRTSVGGSGTGRRRRLEDQEPKKRHRKFNLSGNLKNRLLVFSYSHGESYNHLNAGPFCRHHSNLAPLDIWTQLPFEYTEDLNT